MIPRSNMFLVLNTGDVRISRKCSLHSQLCKKNDNMNPFRCRCVFQFMRVVVIELRRSPSPPRCWLPQCTLFLFPLFNSRSHSFFVTSFQILCIVKPSWCFLLFQLDLWIGVFPRPTVKVLEQLYLLLASDGWMCAVQWYNCLNFSIPWCVYILTKNIHLLSMLLNHLRLIIPFSIDWFQLENLFCYLAVLAHILFGPGLI
jgi:hypothetical protein